MTEFIAEAKAILKAALDQNWDFVEEQCSDLLALADKEKDESKLAFKVLDEHLFNLLVLSSPLSEHNDNIIHFLVHSKRYDLLEKIVRVICSTDSDFLSQPNVAGNTVLHEAAISVNLEAVKLLDAKNGELVETTNEDGETPLFRAAAFGKTKVVKFLASRIDPNRKDVHCKRKDGSSMLFAAVQGKHFGTALEVLKLFEHITQLEAENMTSLHMLAKIPSALNSNQQMGIWQRFLYFFVPVGYGHDDDADNIEMTARKLKETERGVSHEGSSVGLDMGVEKGIRPKGHSVRSTDDKPAESKKEDKKSCLRKVWLMVYATYLSIWKLINSVCPPVWRIWKKKRDNIFANDLARKLIKESSTWEDSTMAMGLRGTGRVAGEKQRIPLFAAKRKGNAGAVEYLLELYPEALDPNNHSRLREMQEKEEKIRKIPLFATSRAKQEGCVKSSLDFYPDALDQIPLSDLTNRGNLEYIKFLLELCPLALEQINHRRSPEADTEEEEECGDEEERETPLLAAIRTGNVELVKLIIEEYPQALTESNHRNQNIFHLSAMYRQKEIFKLVKEKQVLTNRLARQIDVAGYTVLHCVADTKHYIGGTRSGPAYQLKAELEWFKRVEKIMPAYYTMLPDKINNKTSFEIFKEKHKKLHKEAQQWMKDTSQSCSAVAVLVATVVFAAAFTVPGGTDKGQPILIHSPFFLFFTVMDVIALSCSLTAVLIFLSILTSPFELDDFYASLPRRLTLGFALLFMSVATTMLAFASTIFLVMHLNDRRAWTTTLICSASFFPVSVLALTHFPLFMSFINTWMNLFKFIWNALPGHSAIRHLKSTPTYKKVIRFWGFLRNKCRHHLPIRRDDKKKRASKN